MDPIDRLLSLKKSTYILSAINLIGGCIFLLFFLSAANFAKSEERDYYDFGDNLNFLLIVIPVVFVCGSVNLGWAIKALVDILRHHSKEAAVVWLSTVATWIILYFVCQKVSDLPPNPTYPPTLAPAAPAGR